MEGTRLSDLKNLEQDIDTIESGYEFLLAYAAQGRPPHVEAEYPTPHAGPTLKEMLAAMQNVHSALKDSDQEYEQVIVEDIRKASAAVKFVIDQPKMSSELIDNLNASIHLRAVLTDCFLYSEVFRPSAGEAAAPAGGDTKGKGLWTEA
jgi:ribulose bisphosphate carboxylase small subunit